MKRGLMFFVAYCTLGSIFCTADDEVAEFMPHAPSRQRLHNLWCHANNYGRCGGYCYAVEPWAPPTCLSGTR